MKRRTFFAGTLSSALAFSLPKTSFSNENQQFAKTMIKPFRLKPGAGVSLIAPSSPPAEIKFQQAFKNLENLGFKAKPGKNMRAQYGYLAGTDAERVADIHAAFTDPETEVVWCVRGGYGATRLLPLLDYDLIRKHPKPLIGYSDITALHIALQQKAGLVSYHGQVGGAEITPFTLHHFEEPMFNAASQHMISLHDESLRTGPEYEAHTITGGIASGKLTGGNIAVLTAMVGTEFSPVFKDKIVFLEEIGEAPYRVDRMLTQLLQATDLSKAAGIVLGVFNDCEQKGDSPTLKLKETLKDRLSGLNIPVYYGAPFGHIAHQCILPYGIKAAMDADKMTLVLQEPAVR